MSEIYAFVEEIKSKEILPLEKLYEDYYHWCKSSGADPMSRIKFNREVHNYGNFHDGITYHNRKQRVFQPFI
jgi:phage/plasmid-associated DNA primase